MLTMVKSTAYFFFKPGKSWESAQRPGFPIMSPTKSMFRSFPSKAVRPEFKKEYFYENAT